ncbi:hypothetical protein Halha_0946 [Halobacteroides halobius DSM 5150]|uniref:Uncharacterized protein n=1 Tax=Halobacteroides halobius (strain ATCC 35273 / DSM 5150 / MD-1) TaxID=748449 RepID=L0K6M3_HALHC|nr:hypothetical protein [Halobacteroides halobius]AGB40907.1 hypothetical protein Halha_0946 [Halobacteroides halobius DSM 5150]
MRLCDDCIQKVAGSLSNQAQQTLNQLSPLFEEEVSLTGQVFEQTTALNRNAIKEIIAELESNLLLDHSVQGRKKVFYLTESGARYLELQNNPKSKKEESTNETEELEIEEVVEKAEDDISEIEDELIEKEEKDKEQDLETEESEDLTEEKKIEGEDNLQTEEKDDKQQDSGAIVWDFDL